jgi:hypothetical protein
MPYSHGDLETLTESCLRAMMDRERIMPKKPPYLTHYERLARKYIHNEQRMDKRHDFGLSFEQKFLSSSSKLVVRWSYFPTENMKILFA